MFLLVCSLSVGFLPCLCILADCLFLSVGCYHCSYHFVCLTFDVLVRFQQSILSQVSPGTLLAISLHNLGMSPLEFLEYRLLLAYFPLIYSLDLLASAQNSLDQSEVIYHFNSVFDICKFIFSVLYFFFQLVLCFFSNLIPFFQLLQFVIWLLKSSH